MLTHADIQSLTNFLKQYNHVVECDLDLYEDVEEYDDELSTIVSYK